MTDIQERVTKLLTQLKAREVLDRIERGLVIHPEEYIVHLGEVPWWEVKDPKERHRTGCRQRKRVWSRDHLEKAAEATA